MLNKLQQDDLALKTVPLEGVGYNNREPYGVENPEIKHAAETLFIDDQFVRLKTSSINNDKYASTLSAIHDYLKNERLTGFTITRDKLSEPTNLKFLINCFASRSTVVLNSLYRLMIDLTRDSKSIFESLAKHGTHNQIAKTYLSST